MPQNTHIELASAEAESLIQSASEGISGLDTLRSHATQLARSLAWLPNKRSSRTFIERRRAVISSMRFVLPRLEAPLPRTPVSQDFRWLHDNVRLLASNLENLREGLTSPRTVPHVRTPDGRIIPRVAAVAESYLTGVSYRFTELSFAAYIEAFEEITNLQLGELWALPPVLTLVLLEQIASRSPRLLADLAGMYGIASCVQSLQEIGHTPWKDVLEPLIPFDRILQDDPGRAYSQMDFESRDLYRSRVANIAEHSEFTEVEVAIAAIALAREAQQRVQPNPRVTARQSHVGYYLVAEGAPQLHQRVSYRAPLAQRMQAFLRAHPDESYLSSIEVFTFGLIILILLPLVGAGSSLSMILFSLLVLLLPCSQSAVRLANYLITSLLPAQILPKLDLSEGIPDDCCTMVAVPTLLLNKKQIERLVDDLEVRFLANHDENVYFVLLTDLPDSLEPAQEDDPRVALCSELISELNEKYAGGSKGPFLLLHRHRVYNPRERMWMGWERKRGKLLDLNKLLRNQFDSFPIKTGDLSILPRVRFVITLDSDTELPRGSAHRMIGTLAHPLNQAIIDPEKNIVVSGYGILQPRTGVSVQSAARSRLASIYSGETGFDIYTRAVSDIYQDLYGEGIFAGKGIYEVDTLHQVLDQRFPRNALLSHDLIEGAYARAGLVTDVEVIEDYPSHYSAYNRRKHRWLRGDWQITEWLLPKVPDEAGNQVPNPISLASKWKIFDNLRRSLVEPATLLLLVLGWLVLPGSPTYWTIATIMILFVPAWCWFLYMLVRAVIEHKEIIARDAFDDLFTANVNVFFTLTFLAHQTLLSIDAVVRTLVRRIVTRRRLLQWESAAEAELGTGSRTSLDAYLGWIPLLAIGLGVLVFWARREAAWAALPILLLWACSSFIARWLNQSPHMASEASRATQLFLRHAALRTWRYFSEFSTEEHNWLIPDNVQEDPALIAPRISPTNLGFLLNARQVACEFGYLTVPEFAELSQRTLETTVKFQRYRGHMFNWYDTRTLEPLPPRFVSSVDSGNLVASLWTLQQGALEYLRRPLLRPGLAEGLLDHFRLLAEMRAVPRKIVVTLRREITRGDWLGYLLSLPDTSFKEIPPRLANTKKAADARWALASANARLENIRLTVRTYTPWLLPEFASLRDVADLNLRSGADAVLLERIPGFMDKLTVALGSGANSQASSDDAALRQQLLALLPAAYANVVRLIEELREVARSANKLANEMDFGFLLNPRRKLLSIGYDAESNNMNPACYDLLETESRIAVFVAITQEHIPQECWFLLGRAHTLDHGRPILLSWTGTMFEYLMPSLWMQTYPNTLLERSRIAAVRSQQAYTARKHIPWGISESAYFKTDEAGNYQYRAFGIPHLALHKGEEDALVISPYSSFLALNVDSRGTLQNLRKMAGYGWCGAYGFYEAADFTPARRRSRFHRYELVRCWMTHHQGMTLLSIANFLYGGVVQRWFHADLRVQATELLLHEKPVSHVRPVRTSYETLAS